MIVVSKRGREYQKGLKQGLNVAGEKEHTALDKIKKFIALILFCTFIFFAGRLFLHQQQQLESLNNQKSELEGNIREIQERTRTLQEEILRLQDRDYIEQVARSEYGMVGEDDIVFVPARGIGE